MRENGFPLSEVIAGGWKRSEDMLASHPNSKKTFLIDGRAPKAGEVFKNPDLAASLRRVAEQGRDGYYKGPTAEAILAISEETGGVFAAADLTEYEPEWMAPIQTTYRGWTVSEIGPNTQGIAALMMLNLMERYPLGEYGFHSAKALHVMVEAKKLAYADMLHYVGDARFSEIPVPDMLDKAHAAERAKLIDAQKAACVVDAFGISHRYRRRRRRHDLSFGNRSGRQYRFPHPEQLWRLRVRARAARCWFHAA